MNGHELDDRDKTLLDIFGKVWPKSGPKATAIREATSLSPTAATQIVNALIDTEAALAYAPITVKRLRRIREAALRKSRSAKQASDFPASPSPEPSHPRERADRSG